MEESSVPRTTYMRTAENNSELLADRKYMLRCYKDDVEEMANTSPCTAPSHVSFLKQGSSQLPVLRILQWNLNVLYGYDLHSPVKACEVAELIDSFNADIVLLQEGGIQTFSKNITDERFLNLQDSSDRLIELHDRLRAMGYQLIFADNVPNPSMLATRLQVLRDSESFCIDKDHDHYQNMVEQFETRSARFVTLSLLNSIASSHVTTREDSISTDPYSISVCITHLHHTEKEMRGVRLGEIRSILKKAPSDTSAVLISTDFNQARRKDYTIREWEVVQAGLRKIDQPSADGVFEELTNHGFFCTLDKLDPSQKLAFTHWTSCIVDFAYLKCSDPSNWSVSGVYAVPNSLSDHLPIVHDLIYSRPVIMQHTTTERRHPVYESSCLQNCLLCSIQNPFAILPLCAVFPISCPLIYRLPDSIQVSDRDKQVLMSYRCGFLFEDDYAVPFSAINGLQIYEFPDNCVGDIHSCCFSLCNCSSGCFTAGGVNFRFRTATQCLSRDIYCTPSDPKQLLDEILQSGVVAEDKVMLVPSSVCSLNRNSGYGDSESNYTSNINEVYRVVNNAKVRNSTNCIII